MLTPTDALDAWQKAAADVARGRSPQELATIVAVTPQSVRNWLSGRCIPTAGRWKDLVVEAGLDHRWSELSAARDAVVRWSPGRPRLADEEYAAGIVARRNRKAATRAAPGAP